MILPGDEFEMKALGKWVNLPHREQYVTQEPVSKIFHKFKSSQYEGYRFVVLGQYGATGKTWLAAALRGRGFDAIDLSEQLNGLVSYNDRYNHIIINHRDSQVMIVLNQPLESIERRKHGI